MKQNLLPAIALATCLAAGAASAADNTLSGQASTNAAQSGSHASASTGHAIAASGQVTSAASTVPLAISGAALGSGAAVSMGAAHGSAKAATSPIGPPLEITDETITVMPPNEALKKNPEAKPDGKSDKNI